MKVFVSSVIGGFEPFRAAARAAVGTLHHQPVMAEDFPASPASPQLACLTGVRSADIVVLVLGARYGDVQGDSGVSPTHEEYVEAKGRKEVLVFLQKDVTFEPRQRALINDIGQWQSGHFRKPFATPEELKDLIIQALHDYALAHAAGPLDLATLKAAAFDLLPELRRNNYMGDMTLHLAVAGGPAQAIMRPAELEAPGLSAAIHRQTLFGEPALFDTAKGVQRAIEGDALVIAQERGARVRLDEQGGLLLRLPLERDRHAGGGLPSIIEEMVQERLLAGLAFASWVLDQVDAGQRLGQLALAASIEAGDYLAWRTQAEQHASPNTVSMSMGARDQKPAGAQMARPALPLDPRRYAEDLMVRLRRQWKPSH